MSKLNNFRSNVPTSTHPDLKGLTLDDFEENCNWDTVDMSFLSKPNYYQIWNSKMPLIRTVSIKNRNLPIYLVARTNYNPGNRIRNMDTKTIDINSVPNKIYIKLFNLKWLPLFTKLVGSEPNNMYFKLVQADCGLLGSHVSHGTNLVITSASTTFVYQPVYKVFLDNNHVWFSLYPQKPNGYELQIIRKLPPSDNLDY